MAILKDVTTPAHAVTGYHRVVHFEGNCEGAYLDITVAGYVSAEARAAGARPLWHEYVRIPFSAFEQDPRSAIYQAIRDVKTPLYDGAGSDTDAPANCELRIKPASVEPA